MKRNRLKERLRSPLLQFRLPTQAYQVKGLVTPPSVSYVHDGKSTRKITGTLPFLSFLNTAARLITSLDKRLGLPKTEEEEPIKPFPISVRQHRPTGKHQTLAEQQQERDRIALLVNGTKQQKHDFVKAQLAKGFNQSQIATQMRLSRGAISQMVKLLRLNGEL